MNRLASETLVAAVVCGIVCADTFARRVLGKDYDISYLPEHTLVNSIAFSVARHIAGVSAFIESPIDFDVPSKDRATDRRKERFDILVCENDDEGIGKARKAVIECKTATNSFDYKIKRDCERMLAAPISWGVLASAMWVKGGCETEATDAVMERHGGLVKAAQAWQMESKTFTLKPVCPANPLPLRSNRHNGHGQEVYAWSPFILCFERSST